MNKTEPEIKIWMGKPGHVFGMGTVRIMKAVDACGSVSEACKHANISYSKGWKIINGAEKELGFSIIERRQGGKNGGSASLTPQSRRYMECYEQLVSEMREETRRRYAEIFRDELFADPEQGK